MTSQCVPPTPDPADAARADAGFLPLQRLIKRSDFLRTARGKRIVTPGFILQMRTRADHDGPMRVGFTCSKKVGTAVARNRAKRRLREVARLVLPQHGHAGTDYVLVGRAQVTATRPFSTLLDDLRAAVARPT